MESALGARKGSSLFGCGLGDGEVGWNPPWGLGKAHRLSVAALAMEGLDGIHLGPWKDSALFGCGPLRWG